MSVNPVQKTARTQVQKNHVRAVTDVHAKWHFADLLSDLIKISSFSLLGNL